MRTASDIVASMRACVAARSPLPKDKRGRRVTAAFMAAVFAVTGGLFFFGADARKVLAFEDDNPAAFWRAERRRMKARRAVNHPAARPGIPVLSIFGGRNAASDARKMRKDRSKVAARKPGDFAIGRRSVCVRLCDGFHFPVGKLNGRGDIRAHEAVCGGLCPGAPTRLYVLGPASDDINTAVSIRTGKPYARLPVASRHTSRRYDTCSCQPAGKGQVAKVSLRRDFTLRKGDAVMTKYGMRIFRGARRYPYRLRDFQPLHRARGISRADRKLLRGIERASGFGRGTPALKRFARTVPEGLITFPAIGPLPPARNRTYALSDEPAQFAPRPSEPDSLPATSKLPRLGPLPPRRPIPVARLSRRR